MASSCSRPDVSRERGSEYVGVFVPQEILAALDRHGVRYVVIGGLAAILHGAPHVTTDVDIVPEEALRNLERLSEVLRELNARIRVAGEEDGVPFGHDADSLGACSHLESRHGPGEPRHHVPAEWNLRVRRPSSGRRPDDRPRGRGSGCFPSGCDQVEGGRRPGAGQGDLPDPSPDTGTAVWRKQG